MISPAAAFRGEFIQDGRMALDRNRKNSNVSLAYETFHFPLAISAVVVAAIRKDQVDSSEETREWSVGPPAICSEYLR